MPSPAMLRNTDIKRESPRHRALAKEVAHIAMEVLPYFEKECLNDDRPRLAIEAIRAWSAGRRKLGLKEVRALSYNAHAAARDCKTSIARYAAHAAGQAVAVWHVPTHARGVLSYVKKIEKEERTIVRNTDKAEPRNTLINKYIARYPKTTQAILKKIRQTIKDVAPQASETISYGIPTFDLGGKHLVHFAGFKDHVSFFPTSSPIPVFKKQLIDYKTSKGTIQFPLGQPIPYGLIKRITVFRLKEVKRSMLKKT